MTQAPPIWSNSELAAQIARATEIFKEERIGEPLELYSDLFDKYRDPVESLLEESVDLQELTGVVQEYIIDQDKRYALRYLASPPVSDDDLKVLADAKFSPAALEKDPDAVARIIEVVLAGLDRWRFPWLTEGREATEMERRIATISTTSLIATSRLQTYRRNTQKTDQEEHIADALRSIGFQGVPTRNIGSVLDAPAPGEFCHESLLGGSKADIIARLWDGRILAIEAKVTNSATNSVKRVNREAATKAVNWLNKFGTLGVIPCAVLSGVFKVHNLVSAQNDGLTIFWAHDLDRMLEFIKKTR
ncbi:MULTISPECIES: XamI family restriction endonuclease [unclassified Actinobaculum]|uniref:XamI family restriction endonuclease n=1 Tax=unclassified Actinobaculum TaxID=2609299 RepID=UPI000D527B29|nr:MULTISPECIES: XamI family restriction endonuclease [unclassified Actinobaculum]AWE43316.1 XamI family restriction endonuclease [Actinobaculum sp. 313]RTE49787.1 XamI family restriction endonuclease [Actinobaculum sp. 352]